MPSLSFSTLLWIAVLLLLHSANAQEPTIETGPIPSRGDPILPLPPRAYIEECRVFGFDPLQLACTTCAVLPVRYQNKCERCCTSYRSLEKVSKRYELAVVLSTGYPPSLQEFLEEDKDLVLNQKGRNRLMLHEVPVDPMMGMFMGQTMSEPSAIFWFDEKQTGSLDLDDLASKASEITVLVDRGLGRDDIREMLLALLPDKE